ncbi:MAG: tyrosine-type recombinase/integrase [Candidatus Bathyarchaeia archaeon]
MTEIYEYAKRLESARRRIKGLANSSFLLSFIDHLEALGLSAGRVAKYANHICALMKKRPFDPRNATKMDIEGVIAWINGQPYKSSTKEDLKVVVRKLVQYAKCGSCARRSPLPPEVAWFSVNRNDKDSRVKPESLLSLDDVRAMINVAENERDKALLSVLFEAALRPGEILTMNVGSVTFKDDYCLIAVHGKTGVKRIPLVASYRLLLEWMMKHPKGGDPAAPLWISLSNNSKRERMSYHYFRKLVRGLAERAGVKKNVWPYLFRHTCLTSLAKILTEAKLELYAGWVHGSDMTRRYVHFSARDLEETVLEVHGLKKGEHVEGIMKLKECPRCGSRNSPNSVRCSFCGYILDRKCALEEEGKRAERLEDIVKRLERLEQAVCSFLGGKDGSPPKQQP